VDELGLDFIYRASQVLQSDENGQLKLRRFSRVLWWEEFNSTPPVKNFV
jgi:hypothetical protein